MFALIRYVPAGIVIDIRQSAALIGVGGLSAALTVKLPSWIELSSPRHM